jgi:hypothetical protein
MDDFDPEQLKEFEENLRSMNASMGSTTDALNSLAAQLSKLADQQIDSSQRLSKGMADLSNQVSQETQASKADTEAKEQIKIASEALERSFKSASAAVTDFSAQILSGKEGFSKYGSALSGLGDSTAELTSTMGPLAKGIGIAIDLFSKLAVVMMAQTDMQNQFVKDMNAMGALSGTTSDKLTDLARDAGYAATDLEKLSPMLQQASMGLAGFGKGVADGTMKVLETLKLDDKQEAMMRRYAYSLEEANEAQLFYMQLQRTSGANLQTQNMTAGQLQKRSLDYAKNLRVLSELTGKNADKLKAEQEIIASDIRNRVRQIADEDELVRIRQQIAETEDGARKEELKKRQDSLENEMEMRRQMTVDFGQAGPEFAKSLKNVIEYGGIDESTKSLAVIFSNAGVGVGELQSRFKDLEAGSQEYDDAVTQTMDEFSEGVRRGAAQLEQTVGATGPGETEAGQIFGLTNENLEAVTVMRENAERRNKIEAGILDATEEEADGQKDTAAALQVFERNVRTGADEFLDSINIFNTSLNAQIMAMGFLFTAAIAASVALGRLAVMGGPGTLGKMFGKSARNRAGVRSAGGAGNARTLMKVGKIGGGIVGAGLAIGGAAMEAQDKVNTSEREFAEKAGQLDKSDPQYERQLQRLRDERDIEKQGARVVGTTKGAGGAGGALGGAALGAAIGTAILPGIGTAIGGLIGAGLGAWVGSELGEVLGEALSPEEMAAYQASEKEVALMSPEEKEEWQKQYDQAQKNIELAKEQLEETKKTNKINLDAAEESGLYDKDLIGASEISWETLQEMRDGDDESRATLKGQLVAILADNDLREEDRATLETQLASLEALEDSTGETAKNTRPEEETEEKSFATMTQAELYAHFEKVRDGEQPDMADDKKGWFAGAGEKSLADPSVADANGIINVDETITTTKGADDSIQVPGKPEYVDVVEEDKRSIGDMIASADSALAGFLRDPFGSIGSAIKGNKVEMAGDEARYTQEDIDALPEDQQELVQVGDAIEEKRDGMIQLFADAFKAGFETSPLMIAGQSIINAVQTTTANAEEVTKIATDSTEKIRVEAETTESETTFAQTTVDGETQSVTEYKETLDIQKQQLAETRKQNELLVRGLAQGSEQVDELNKIVTRASV